MIKFIDRLMEIFVLIIMIIFFLNAALLGQIFFGGLIIWYVRDCLNDRE